MVEMDIVLIFLFLFVVLLLACVAGYFAYRAIEDSNRRRKAACIVYIMRVDGSGKIELKRSPEQLWHWKF